ncbi:MAG: hypothetical protein IT365_24070 [Candidatus Hydrogenedentes bacterium]|nr:hypothetical protein [Candidatus Hydrogenedentota bacterium]
MKALRIHVERIVRPIRASVLRKNKMREELLAHLETAFEEESAVAISDCEALEQATKRLGDPRALREELQASVPWIERVGFSRIPLRLEPEAYASDEPFGWRGSARIATGIVALTVVLSSLFFAINQAVSPDTGLAPRLGIEVLERLPLLAVSYGCEWVAFFATYLLFDLVGLRDAMSPWNRMPSFVKACLSVSSLIIAAGFFLVMAVVLAESILWGKTPHLIAKSVIADIQSVPYWVWLGALCFSVLYTMNTKHRERRQYEEWGCLQIEDDSGMRS